MVISLERFKTVMKHIEAQEAKDDVLSDLLVCEDTTGWVSTAGDLITDVISLLAENLSDGDNAETAADKIYWWLYEVNCNIPNASKDMELNKVWVCIEEENKTYAYTIEDLDDLYYLIINDLDSIKKKEESEPPSNPIFMNMDAYDEDDDSAQTLYDIFLRSFGLTESDN